MFTCLCIGLNDCLGYLVSMSISVLVCCLVAPGVICLKTLNPLYPQIFYS